MNGCRGYYAKEKSQTETLYDFTYLCNLKKRKQIHCYREQIGGCQRGEVGAG